MNGNGDLIYSVCRYRLGPSFSFAVEDAASETALRLYRTIERQVLAGEPVRCNRTFIRMVATRTSITLFNRHVREIEQRKRLVNDVTTIAEGMSLQMSQAVVVADLDDDELAALLQQLPEFIASLGSRDQSLLRLYYLSTPPLTWDAIGERLAMAPPAARQAGRRALKKLSAIAHSTLEELRRGDV